MTFKRFKYKFSDFVISLSCIFATGGVITLILAYVCGIVLIPITIVWAIYKLVTHFLGFVDKFASLTTIEKFALTASVFFFSYLLLFSFLKAKIDDLNYKIDTLESEKYELQQLLREADDAFNRQAELHKKRKDRDGLWIDRMF